MNYLSLISQEISNNAALHNYGSYADGVWTFGVLGIALIASVIVGFWAIRKFDIV